MRYKRERFGNGLSDARSKVHDGDAGSVGDTPASPKISKQAVVDSPDLVSGKVSLDISDANQPKHVRIPLSAS